MHHLPPSIKFIVAHCPAVFGILAIPNLICLIANSDTHEHPVALGALTVSYIAVCFWASWKRELLALALMPALLSAIFAVKAFDHWGELTSIERFDFASGIAREIITVSLTCLLVALYDLWKAQ